MLALYYIGRGLQWLAGIAAFLWGLVVAYALWGVVGLIVAIFVFPATTVLAPLYAAIAWGAWFPFLAPIVVSIAGAGLMSLAMRLAPEE